MQFHSSDSSIPNFRKRSWDPSVRRSMVLCSMAALPIVLLTATLWIVDSSAPNWLISLVVSLDCLAPLAPIVPLARACWLKSQRAPTGTHPVRNTVLVYLLGLPVASIVCAIVGINVLSPSTAEGGQQLGGAALISLVWGGTLGGYLLALFQLWLAHRRV